MTHTSAVEPTLAPVVVERTMTTRAAASVFPCTFSFAFCFFSLRFVRNCKVLEIDFTKQIFYFIFWTSSSSAVLQVSCFFPFFCVVA